MSAPGVAMSASPSLRRIGLVLAIVFGVATTTARCQDAASSDNLHITRVRGISLEMKALYDPLKDFQCLDGSMKLPFSYVNDDYCDCPDGSDEPGTAACTRATFHCINLMHSPLDIPSSRVNDGLCDCCDGSDEYASGVSCPNRCEELGRAAREAAKRREELLSQGSKLRRSMVEQGKLKVAEAKQKVTDLKDRVEEAKKHRDEADQVRKDAEEIERKMLDLEAQQKKEQEQQASDKGDAADTADSNSFLEEDKQRAKETFEQLDTNEDGIVTYSEIMDQEKFDQNKDGSVSEDEAKFFLAYLDEVDADEFVSTAWPLIKPVWLLGRQHAEDTSSDAVKDSTTASTEAPADGAPPAQKSVERERYEDELLDDLGDHEHGPSNAEVDDIEDGEQIEPTPPEFPPRDVDAEKDSGNNQERDPAVKAAVDVADKARSDYHDTERKYKELEDELLKYEQIMNGDFGDESEFAPLRGECYELTEKEYIYKLCPFDHCSQRSKDGGSETSLGRWVRWDQRDGNRYAFMKFEGGTGCWNGPARSTVVRMQCGLSSQLVAASEPSRCEYLFEFATPAACFAGMPAAGDDHSQQPYQQQQQQQLPQGQDSDEGGHEDSDSSDDAEHDEL